MPTDCAAGETCNTVSGNCEATCGNADETACNGGACVSNSCVILTDGNACTAGGECQSGMCVDGVCCNSVCIGGCEACSAALKGSGTDGVCGPIAAGADPENECAQDVAASCGQTGFCDGAGACQLYDGTTVCEAGSCTGSTETSAAVCDGAGSCGTASTSACPNALVCGGNSCRSDCAGSDANCVAGNYCDAANTCQPQGAAGDACTRDGACQGGNYCDLGTGICTAQVVLGSGCTGTHQCLEGTCIAGSCQLMPNGSACSGDGECANGHCADGLCCDTACTGLCESCAAVDTGGVDGTCAPVSAGTDPADACPDDGQGSCKRNGFCDGAGACQFYPAGPAGPPACNPDDTAVDESFCAGDGGYAIGNADNCSPYLCASGACLTACGTNDAAGDANCQSTKFCDGVGGGACVDPLTTGQLCERDRQCANGTCVITDGTGACN